MVITHVFGTVTVARVAEVAGVHETTALRWKAGRPVYAFAHVARLHAHGIVTDGDLRAAGLAIAIVGNNQAATFRRPKRSDRRATGASRTEAGETETAGSADSAKGEESKSSVDNGEAA